MLKKLIVMAIAFYTALAMASVDVNKASQTELTEVKGIGPATATRIMDARKQGPFKSWEDLIQRVKGIGDASASKLSDGGLTVNGLVFRQTDKPTDKQNAVSEKNAKPIQTAGKKAEKS